MCKQPGIALIALYVVTVAGEMNENLKYELASANRCDAEAAFLEGHAVCAILEDQVLLPRCYADRHPVQ
jgi:hypothetical protein